MSGKFRLKAPFKPAGDQPRAIRALTEGLRKGYQHQTLLGVTGSGKTFTVASVIEKIQKPTLVIAHNKTLAAQLSQEYRDFFPDSAVHYFVSYYDYYQPEAYLPVTDTYIEKEAQINEEIDRLRHAATQALLTRSDVIVVASVSCIYSLGSPIEYQKVNIKLQKGQRMERAELIRSLIYVYFERTTADLKPGMFRALGNMVEIMPPNEKVIIRLEFEGGRVKSIARIDEITRRVFGEMDELFLFPAKHFITPEDERGRAIEDIKTELAGRLKELDAAGKILEAERLRRRTKYDIAMMREIGYCNGIENYSRHFDGRKPGEPPYTLLSYFSAQGRSASGGPNTKGLPDFLTVIDESHVTVPQISGMYYGDKSRKETLIEHGFRLPSAIDNRPLTFEEFNERVGQIMYTSATPASCELGKSEQIVEQIIRPTGLVDPEISIRPVVSKTGYSGQVPDFIEEAKQAVLKKGRVLVTTLTKKMAEDLSSYLKEQGVKAEYLHSDVATLDRITLLSDFRRGKFDCLVGVNLLREGLDLPEVTLVGILDADKEGFLRSETSLVQTIGRAARNVAGRVILYADTTTGSITKAVGETDRRRVLQLAYNKKHHITPKTIVKNVRDITDHIRSEHQKAVASLLVVDEELYRKNPKQLIAQKREQMSEAVKILDFESAAILRDEIALLQGRNEEKNKKTTA